MSKKNARKRRKSQVKAAQAWGYAIVALSRRGKPTGEYLTDPKRYAIPRTTTNKEHARRFKARNGAHKFLVRHPELNKHFRYAKVA